MPSLSFESKIFEDLSFNLQEEHIEAQLARTLDFRDNMTTDGVGNSSNWVYQGDGDISTVEWPLDLDISYSENSSPTSGQTL
mgnify:CR=1 FL=1